MRTPLPALLLALAAGALRAELPPAVLDACLRPTLTDQVARIEAYRVLERSRPEGFDARARAEAVTRTLFARLP